MHSIINYTLFDTEKNTPVIFKGEKQLINFANKEGFFYKKLSNLLVETVFKGKDKVYLREDVNPGEFIIAYYFLLSIKNGSSYRFNYVSENYA